ncbi:hypothetical protein [Immundisolibacter sp.]|uniref:hypothetical protein n=1 Tax=Immundisolibacter sp. TaxID=1934948 RepID=UPI003F86CEE6
MNLAPMLGDYTLPRVTRLETLEQRRLVELDIPGRAGNLFQDLGRGPARLVVEGSVFGDEPGSAFLSSARERYLAGEPLTFVSDIATGTALQYVMIERLHVQAAASAADQVDYTLWLVECPPPPPPSDLLGGIDDGLLDAAAGMLDSALGALDSLAALGSLPELSDPTAGLSDMLGDAGDALGALGSAGGALGDLLGG